MAVGLNSFKDRQRSLLNQIDSNSPKMQFKTIYTIEFECILNGLP